MSFVEKKLEEHAVYEGRVFTIYQAKVQLPDGREALRDRIAHSGGAGILALSARDTVYLVRQYRFGVGKALLEIPAGKLEPGEDPQQTALRELAEEAGIFAGNVTPLGHMELSPAYLGEITWLYLGRELVPRAAEKDADEFLDLVELPFQQALQQVLSGEISDGKTQTAILKAAVLLGYAK